MKREALTYDDQQVQRSNFQVVGVIQHTNILDVKAVSSIRLNQFTKSLMELAARSKSLLGRGKSLRALTKDDAAC